MAVKSSKGGSRSGKSRTKRSGGPAQSGRGQRKAPSARATKTKVKGAGGKAKARGAGGGSHRAKSKSKPKSSFSYGLVRWAAYWSTVAALWGTLIVAGFIGYYALTMPDPHLVGVSKKSPNVKILGDDGTLLSNQGARWSHVYLEDLPPYVVDAVLSTEDRRFYSHIGVDLVGLARAMVVNARAGRVVQGGSTITQQLAKNLYLSPKRTFDRKIREISMALWLETAMTKNEILELYLNRVYFGAGAYGLSEAAWRYFGKSAEKLTLGEAAVLAGLLKAPSRFAPNHNEDGARARARVVLQNMVSAGKLKKSRMTAALKEPLRLTGAIRHAGGYNYAVDWVRHQLPDLIGSIEDDIVVKTTLNPRLQVFAQQSIEHVMAGASEMLGAKQAAAVVLAQDGAVKVVVGGRSYVRSQFNRAIYAKRQPGSAFKPFVFLSALEAGWQPDSMVEDKPIRVGKWQPRNASGKFYGPLSLRSSFAKSVNTVPVRLTMRLGSSRVINTAKRLGITSALRSDASIALGTSEVSLLELTSAYAPFANGGLLASPYIVEWVKRSDGRVLYRRNAGSKDRVVSAQNAAEMTAMMRSVVAWGTGKSAQISGLSVAGKTGTSQGFRDAWFVGFSPRFIGGVWVGNDDSSAMKHVSGGGLSAKIWRKIMMGAHKKHVPLARRSQSSSSSARVQASAVNRGSQDSIVQLLSRH